MNCAGVLRRAGVPEGLDVFHHVLEVNLVGTMRTCVAARELLVATQGSIVNVGSMFSFFGSGHAPGYGASKAAIMQLTKSLAASFTPHVRVNAVTPGSIRTAMTSPLRKNPEAQRHIISRTPTVLGEPANMVKDRAVAGVEGGGVCSGGRGPCQRGLLVRLAQAGVDNYHGPGGHAEQLVGDAAQHDVGHLAAARLLMMSRRHRTPSAEPGQVGRDQSRSSSPRRHPEPSLALRGSWPPWPPPRGLGWACPSPPPGCPAPRFLFLRVSLPEGSNGEQPLGAETGVVKATQSLLLWVAAAVLFILTFIALFI